MTAEIIVNGYTVTVNIREADKDDLDYSVELVEDPMGKWLSIDDTDSDGIVIISEAVLDAAVSDYLIQREEDGGYDE